MNFYVRKGVIAMNHVSTSSLVVGMHVRDVSDDEEFWISSIQRLDYNLWLITTTDGDTYNYDSWDKFEILKD